MDNHTRVLWVFLMKDESETTSVLKNFHMMIQTQFSTQIHVLCNDRARDYFNSIESYLASHGIVHQSSCVNTPKQKEVEERKNHHLLEYARFLLFTYKVPSHFWGETLFTTTYLINCMVLVFSTTKLLLRLYVNTFLKPISSTHIHSQHRGKLEPRANN